MRSIINKNFKGIIDSTLREGLQFRYGKFDLNQQKTILKYLSNIGVDRIEVNNPLKEETRQAIKTLSKVKVRSKILCHIRNKTEDVNAAIHTSIDGVNILCTVDNERILGMKTNFNSYLKDLKRNVSLVKEKDLEIRVSVEDFFGQATNRAIRVYKLADQLGVDRIGVADTLGKAFPWEVENRIFYLRKLVKTEIEVHFHNDLGQAVTNAIASLRAGANWVDTTLLGIGERTGITALSLFLANLYILDKRLVERYNLKPLTKAENYVAKICKISMPFNILTNRSNGFTHKAGIHLNALIKHGPKKYELLPPSVIGNERTLIHDSDISGKTTKEDVNKFYEIYGK